MSKRKTKGEMFPLIEEWQRSGLSQKAFCIDREVDLSVFTYWRRKHNQAHEFKSEFVELIPTSTQTCEISYPNGVVVRLPTSDTQILKLLINVI